MGVMLHSMDGRTTVQPMGMVSLMSLTLGLMDPTLVGDMWTKVFLMIEGVQFVMIYMIEICIHHHPLLAPCGLSLEETLMRNLRPPKITEGTKGLEVEIVGSLVLSLKTVTRVLTKAERTAMKEIISMGVTAVIQTMKGAGEIVVGEGMIRLSMTVKGKA